MFKQKLMLLFIVMLVWLVFLFSIWLLRQNYFIQDDRTMRQVSRLKRGRKTQYDKDSKTYIDDLLPTCRKAVFLVVVVFSAPTGFDRRNAIRCSWGKRLNQRKNYLTDFVDKDTSPGVYNRDRKPLKVVFLVGQSKNKHVMSLVRTESHRFGDLVLGSFTDSYGNLTLKTRLGLHWVHYQCGHFQYFLKADDDVFVNTKTLLQWLWQLPRTNMYTGYCASNRTVVRQKGHKWAVSRHIYQNDTYPTYCYGMGYILSQDVVGKVMTLINHRPIFSIEDVYVGLILRELKVVPVDNRERFIMKSKLLLDNICKNKHILVVHKVKSVKMFELYLKFLNTEDCPK